MTLPSPTRWSRPISARPRLGAHSMTRHRSLPMDTTGDFRHDGPRGDAGQRVRGHRGRMAPREQRELSRWRLARGRPARDDPVTGREEASGGTIAVILPDTRDRHPGTGLFDSCAVRPPGPTRLARRTQSAPSSCGRAEQVTECRTGSPVRGRSSVVRAGDS